MQNISLEMEIKDKIVLDKQIVEVSHKHKWWREMIKRKIVEVKSWRSNT